MLKAFDPARDNVNSYLPWLLMSYRSIPHTRCLQRPSAIMGRQIQSPITMFDTTNEKKWSKKQDVPPERANFFMQRGHNMALINKNWKKYVSTCRPGREQNRGRGCGYGRRNVGRRELCGKWYSWVHAKWRGRT